MRALIGSALLWLSATPGGVHAQDLDLDLAGYVQALENARHAQVDVLAPAGFAAAVLAQQNAARDAAKGRKPEKVRAQIQEGEGVLARASQAAAGARQLLGSVIKAREDALAAHAGQHAAEAWAKAAERFDQAMRENERGKTAEAQRRAAEAEVLLRNAELLAIKDSVLHEARVLIAQADRAKLDRLAPQSLSVSRRHLSEAEQEIQRNRYDLDAARKLAAQSVYEARHAAYLASVIGRVLEQEKDAPGAVETLLLSWEEPLRRIAAEAELAVSFEQGVQAPMQKLGEHTRQQAQELARLKQELTDREEQIAELNTQMQRLESRLGGVSEERVALQRRVDAQERLRASVAAVEASFTADEARVYRQGDDVVISLLGINFPSGRSTIDGGSAVLMKKVQQALALFPGASISVEGHTDAHGSDSTNLILSQDRADAVKQYLITNFALDPEQVGSIGYGEARPVATNETAEGRARNRRIDLVIHMKAIG